MKVITIANIRNRVLMTLLVFLLSACGSSDESPVKKYNKAYIESQRLCPDMLFKCLPEAQPLSRFKPQNDKDGKTMNKDVYQLSEREEHKIKQRKQQQIFKEVTQMLDLYFPEFWGGKPEQERMQWVYEVYLKIDDYKYHYTRGRLELMATICAIIGIDFDKQAEHEPVKTFLKNDSYSQNARLSETVDYLRFVYLEADYSLDGDFYSNWYLRAALRELPRPERPIPDLNDAPNMQMNHPEYNIMKVYFDTIHGKGKR